MATKMTQNGSKIAPKWLQTGSKCGFYMGTWLETDFFLKILVLLRKNHDFYPSQILANFWDKAGSGGTGIVTGPNFLWKIQFPWKNGKFSMPWTLQHAWTGMLADMVAQVCFFSRIFSNGILLVPEIT